MPNEIKDAKGGLLSEPETAGDQPTAAEREQGAALEEAGRAAASIAGADTAFSPESWDVARSVVERFRPVPWFIWRIANFVFAKPVEGSPQIPEGLLLGLRRFLFAVASDPALGLGTKVSDVRAALGAVPPDVIAAAAVIHTVSRRLAAHELERMWRPVLDESVVRARIAYEISKHSRSGWRGRALLSGFATRCGLAVLFATGEEEAARNALERLAEGRSLAETGMEIFGCNPHQVSSLMLSAAGCGRDAASAAICYALDRADRAGASEAEGYWTAFMMCTEIVRGGATEPQHDAVWNRLGITDASAREVLLDEGRRIGRHGHGWPWIV